MIEQSIIKGVFLPDREKCFEFLRKLRWPDGVKCLHCGSSKIYNDGHTDKGAVKYYCLNCDKYFNDLTNTIFWHHKFPIEEMFYILKEMEHKSTLEISNELGRKYDSVLAFVREVQTVSEKIETGVTVKGLIEIDEIYITAGEKGIKQDKPRKRGLKKRGRGTFDKDKPPVMTFTERRGKTRFFVKKNLSKKDTNDTLKDISEGKIVVNTDEYSIYGSLSELENVKEHRTVNHSECYAKDGVHVNTAENRHGFLRTWLRKFRGVSKHYLGKYVSFFELLFNAAEHWFQKIILFPIT